MYLAYGNGFRCFVTLVEVWFVFTELVFALAGLMMSWESYLLVEFILKMKYMTLTFVAKSSLYFIILEMVLCGQPVFAFVYYDCLSSD